MPWFTFRKKLMAGRPEFLQFHRPIIPAAALLFLFTLSGVSSAEEKPAPPQPLPPTESRPAAQPATTVQPPPSATPLPPSSSTQPAPAATATPPVPPPPAEWPVPEWPGQIIEPAPAITPPLSHPPKEPL